MFVRRKGAIAAVTGSDGSLALQGSAESRRRAAARLIETHDAVFRRTARRYSICADDAEDAYQRALEILLTKAPPIDGDNLVRWMQTVTKREALDVRSGRERMLSGGHSPSDERDPMELIPADAPEPDEKAASRERIARSNEALRSLKPNEVRALTLKAEGYSYAEIGDITGWTYTKINRCMAEGRKRFLAVFSELEHGDRCAEMTASLSAMADGESIDGSGDVHAHLRGCATCRAKLRAFRGVPERVLELMPAGAVTELSTRGQASGWFADKLASATEKAKELGYSAMARGSSSDNAVAVAGSGGTRGGGMAVAGKVLAVCGATAAGGAACVAGGIVAPPVLGGTNEPEPPAVVAPDRPIAEAPIDQGEAAPAPADDTVAQQPAPDPSPAPAPTPVQQTKQQFDFEAAAAPAPAPPPTGSSEFGGASSGGSSGGGGSGGGSSGGFGIE